MTEPGKQQGRGRGLGHQSARQQFVQAVLGAARGNGWSQAELARRAWLDPALVNKIVKGTVWPTEESAAALARAVGGGPELSDLAERAWQERQLMLPRLPIQQVGRAPDMARLDELAQAAHPPEVIVVNGQPGVGKTTFALDWANTVQDRYDVVLWSDLRGYSPGDPAQPVDILGDLLRGLGVPANRLPADATGRLASLRGRLAGQGDRVLIVLDNARNSKQIEAVLPSTPRTLVLVTSRRRMPRLTLAHDTRHLALDVLHTDAAAQLVANTVGEDRAKAEADSVLRLVNLCGALPLALTIVGQRIVDQHDKSIRQHVRELTDRGHRLQLLALDEDDTIGVRAAVDLSYESLPDSTARLFRLLGVHPGARFHLGAAAALAGVDTREAARLLEQLIRAHLVQGVDGSYFRLHDLLRVYAANEIARPEHESERTDATVRLVHWYLHTANAGAWTLTPARDHHIRLDPPPPGVTPLSFATSTEAYSWCAAELACITPIAQLALEAGLLFEAWRLPVDLFDYHILGRPWQVWITSYEVALTAAHAAGNDHHIAEAAVNLAEAYRRQGDLDRATALDRMAVDAIERSRRPHSRLGWAYAGLGNTAHAQQRYPEAVEHLRTAVAVHRQVGSRIGEMAAQVHLGRAYRAVGDRDRAIEHGMIALEAFRADDDRHGIAFALVPLARTCRAFGELQEALEYADAGLAAYRDSGDPWGEGEALGLKGQILSDLGQRQNGLACLTKAVAIVDDIDPRKAAELRQEIAALAPTVSRRE
ncbi:tetratricopeptide repeat protein [Amycolatopsis tolypomycina]|uniref:tetratricopeptide repeat protein n=1 Tax=Amycolatopsis tolypomycina TaxID=208445 RepID=UPI0033B7C281